MKRILPLIVLLMAGYLLCHAAEARGKEDTYSISLTRTAEVGVDREVLEVEGKKVLAEAYTVQKGDYLWRIFRKKGLLEKKNFNEILSMLKRLNKSLANIDLIHPGEKIIIPLTISPVLDLPAPARKRPEKKIQPKEIKKVKFENYTVKRGDSLVRVIKGRFKIPPEDLFDEYLNMVKKLNPSMKSLNNIYPGQKIRLPIYSPQLIRRPITVKQPPKPKPPPVAAPKPKIKKATKPHKPLGRPLGRMFVEIGEEWVGTGEHYIPLKSGGQINLKASSYPIIHLSNGDKVIVDLKHKLPKKMAGLITSSWSNYRVVHLGVDDDLRRAFDKIAVACQYERIYRQGEHIDVGGDIPLRITADWMIRLRPDASGEKGKTAVVTLLDNPAIPRIPKGIKTYMDNMGFTIIDFPPKDEAPETSSEPEDILAPGDTAALIELLLKLCGKRFSRKVEIPIYQRKKSDFNLIIKADYLLTVGGKDAIIDQGGLEQEIISLLEEHRFSILSLSGMDDPLSILRRCLDFLKVNFDPGPHYFMAVSRKKSGNIRFTITGLTFRDNTGQAILATKLDLPREIVMFLTGKGYRILKFSVPS